MRKFIYVFVITLLFLFSQNPTEENIAHENTSEKLQKSIIMDNQTNIFEQAEWVHTRYDIRNTGCSPATGKGSIYFYMQRRINSKHIFTMGRGEPKIADIDKDGKTEVIFATATGYLYALEEGKKLDWKCDVKTQVLFISPELGDVNGDGYYEVLVSGDNFLETEYAGLRVVDKDGNLLAEWLNPEGGFPLGEPRAADIDGDGKDEILIGLLGDDKRGNKLYALEYENGKLEEIWHFPAYNWVKYTPAIDDIDGDGEIEIVFSSEDMCLYCLNSTGHLKWKFITDGGIQYARPGAYYRTLYAPVAYDLNGDGKDEIILVAGAHDKNYSKYSKVYCLDYKGDVLWTFKTSSRFLGPPAVGDLDGDNKVEIICADYEKVYSLNAKGEINWETKLPPLYYRLIFYPPLQIVKYYPSIADLDGDGKKEIVLAAYCHGIFILDYRGNIIRKWVHPFGETGYRGAAIGDIDGDGGLEIVFGEGGRRGYIGKLGIIDQLKTISLFVQVKNK